jgi:hypothetical protein
MLRLEQLLESRHRFRHRHYPYRHDWVMPMGLRLMRQLGKPLESLHRFRHRYFPYRHGWVVPTGLHLMRQLGKPQERELHLFLFLYRHLCHFFLYYFRLLFRRLYLSALYYHLDQTLHLPFRYPDYY